MGLSRRKFTKEFKIATLRQLNAGVSIAAVARSCEIDPRLVHRWRQDLQQSPEQAFPGLGKKRSDENRILHSALGYLPPAEFEANLLRANNCKDAASRQPSTIPAFCRRP